MAAEYVYDLSASDAAKLAEQCDRLRAGIELIELAIENSEVLKSENSLAWLSSKLSASLENFAARLSFATGSPAPADVKACLEGGGPFADFFNGIIAVTEFAERYGIEARCLHVILRGMKAVADSLIDFLKNECQTRPLPPVGFRLRQLRYGLPQRQLIEAEAHPRGCQSERHQLKGPEPGGASARAAGNSAA
ncbi:MAG TPA: hypothetical protein VE986_01930 [Hyphomicrobiales bacterium]|nr:hypothetical protein [Hyphomicrobiales bacterium]